MSADEFDALFGDVATWERWPEQGERGALNEVTPERVAAAAGLVRSGVTVTLALPLQTEQGLADPVPADHMMTMMPQESTGPDPVRFAKDYVGVDYHNDGHSHLDAFCHVAYRGLLYGGVPVDAITPEGAAAGTVELLASGLVARGVLLDVPRVRGVPWLEPGEHVFVEDLEAAEREQGVEVAEGDVLLVRVGHVRRLRELGPWDTTTAKAGVHPGAARFLSERRVAALGSDGNNDTAPSTTERIGFPMHVLALNAMGVHLLDYLQLEDLAARCEAEGRWEFLFVAAPLRIQGGTGSPVNPLAIF